MPQMLSHDTFDVKARFAQMHEEPGYPGKVAHRPRDGYRSASHMLHDERRATLCDIVMQQSRRAVCAAKSPYCSMQD